MRREVKFAQLVKYRKSLEDQRRIALAVIEEKQYREKEKLFHLRESQRAYQELLGQDGASVYLGTLDSLAHEALTCRRVLRELQKELLEARNELIESSKARKTIEKLRDREIVRQKQLVARQERKELDEIAAGRFVRMESSL